MMTVSSLLAEAIAQGRTVWLQNLLSELLPNLPKDSQDCCDWFDLILEAFEHRQLIEPSQQKNYLTDVRNAIKVLDPHHPALNIVKFDKETWVEINNANSDRIAQRHTQFLSDPQAIVNRAVELLNSFQWSEIAAGLAVVTGRRCSEVLKTAQFQFQTPYSVSFSGSLKRKGEPTLCVFDIPTLCPAELVIDGIERLRHLLGTEIESLSLRQISGRYSRAVAHKCDEHFADLVPKRTGKDNLYTHLFRAVYATIASHWYCPPHVPEIEYRAAIQGHYQILDENDPQLRRSLAAGRHYFDYQISDGQGNIDGRLGIKLSLNGVSVVSPFSSTQTPIPIQSSTKPTPLVMSESISIPKYLMSRFQNLSEQLNLDPKDTLEALFDWAEVSLALADSLQLPELKTNVLFDEVERLQNSSSVSSRTTNNGSSDLPFDAQNISDLVSSVHLLAQTVARQNQVGHYQTPKRTKSSASLSNHKTETEHNEHEEQKPYSRTQQAEDLINHAIDKIIEFNDQPDIRHQDKFRVGIGCVRKLTRRGDQVIRRVIENRQPELDAHHQKHQLGSTHNSKGKDAPSITDVIFL